MSRGTHAIPRDVYLATHELMIQMLHDERLAVLCPHCRGTAAKIIMEGDIAVGIRCSDSCGGIIWGRDTKR